MVGFKPFLGFDDSKIKFKLKLKNYQYITNYSLNIGHIHINIHVVCAFHLSHFSAQAYQLVETYKVLQMDHSDL